MGFDAIDKRHTPTAKWTAPWRDIRDLPVAKPVLVAMVLIPGENGKPSAQRCEMYTARTGWQYLTQSGWVHTNDTRGTHFIDLIDLQLPAPGDGA